MGVSVSNKRFNVVGVTQLNDSYPNVKYKLAMLARLLSTDYVEFLVPIDKGDPSRNIIPSLESSRFGLVWRMLLGHVKVLFYCLRQKSDRIYVCYPGVFIAACLGLPILRSRYQHMYLDAFISLYDTVVCDRRLIKADSLLAKLLFLVEKKAFSSATTVLVDTPENAQYYSELFQLPLDRFFSMPLSIPPLMRVKTPAETEVADRLKCVFVGTFVPLQGVATIVDAIRFLGVESGIDFVFVGDGQDAGCLQDYIESSKASNVTWHRGHFPTEFVVEQIVSADLCLGVFGEAPKTQRVLPYKIYYYLALAMPVLTASTTATERIGNECRVRGNASPFAVVPAGDAHSLAEVLAQLRDHPDQYAGLGAAARKYYEHGLSEAAIQQSLQELLAAT
jgi:glycosyltransferase involved in cell wall biosynthesis